MAGLVHPAVGRVEGLVLDRDVRRVAHHGVISARLEDAVGGLAVFGGVVVLAQTVDDVVATEQALLG